MVAGGVVDPQVYDSRSSRDAMPPRMTPGGGLMALGFSGTYSFIAAAVLTMECRLRA